MKSYAFLGYFHLWGHYRICRGTKPITR